MAKVLIFGLGSFAQVAYYYLMNDSLHEVVGFTVNEKYIDEEKKFGLEVYPFEGIEKKFPPDSYKMLVAMGYNNVNKDREEKYLEAKSKGYDLISYVCSKSVIWDNVKIGENCFIFENQTIQPWVEIGNNVIIWSGNHIGHHSTIKDHCFITSHVVISGHCLIEPNCYLGVNSTLRDGIKLAKGTVLGAGAIITKDTVENGVYYGGGANLLKKDGTSKNLRKI